MTEQSSSDDSAIRRANEKEPNVVNGHQWKENKSTTVGEYGGKRVTEWKCKGCGKISSSRNSGECPSPTLYVRLACRRDGVGVCEDCGTVFLFDYQQPFYEHGCPNCDSVYWHRDDDADADPDDVVGVPVADGGEQVGKRTQRDGSQRGENPHRD